MTDALAGKRKAIAEDPGLDHVVWPDTGQGPPVDVGDVFELRSFSIQITRRQRTRDKGRFVWVAWFRRRYPARSHILARGGGEDGRGYVNNPERGMRAEDDEEAGTIDRIHVDDEELAHEDHRMTTREPEPEAVAPEEVENLPASVAARAAYAKSIEQRREAERRGRRALVEQLRQAQLGVCELRQVSSLIDQLAADR